MTAALDFWAIPAGADGLTRHREVKLGDGTSYQVHLLAPRYPRALRPWRCRHELDNPQFVMTADVHIVPRKSGGNRLEIDHAVCLACGLPRGATVGGNLLVDLYMLWQRLGWHPEIGARIDRLRQRWTKIATNLFDDRGWNGRHERLARVIDPHLTMRISFAASDRRRMRRSRIARRSYPAFLQPARTHVGTFKFDRTYLRSAA